jgi:hypothetical protein
MAYTQLMPDKNESFAVVHGRTMAPWELNKDIIAARNEFGLASEAWRSAATAAIATTMLSPSVPNFTIAAGPHARCC